MRGGGGRGRWLSSAVTGSLAALALAVPSCTQDQPWAEEAVKWIEARDRAAHRSTADMVMFEAPDGVHVFCCNQTWPVEGREALAAFAVQRFGDSVDEGTLGRAYIDAAGAVVEYRFRAASEDPATWGGLAVGADEVQASEIGASGATATVHATALQFLEGSRDDAWAPYGKDLRAAQGLVERYLSAWSGRDGRAVATQYAEDATVVDSLLGVRLAGTDAIGSYAAEHGGTRLRQDSTPHVGVPALYGSWREFPGSLSAYVTYTGHDSNDCPGGVAAELRIEQGKIVAERRYHDVTSMRRCVDGADLPDGWWTSATIPQFQDRVTGTVAAAGRRIDVHNGSAGANDLVRWAVERFAAAELTAPDVASVAFNEEAHRAECSGDDKGLALKVGADFRVYLCLTVNGPAPPLARDLILHELAHVWMWQHLSARVQRQFVARLELPTWDATDVPWEQRGFEQAAAVIAWGLGDEPLNSRILGALSCPDRVAAFELLTGSTPLQPPCPPGL